jgi:glycosyltransferase involved in cell wall biosynthesis
MAISSGGRLPGNTLFVAGINLCNRLNSPANHLPRHLEAHAEHLDTVGYINFYGGPPAPAAQRLRLGLRNLRADRLRVTPRGPHRAIIARRLHLPSPLEMMLEDLWIFLILRPALAPVYETAVVAHPDNALLAWLLKRTGRVRHLIYNDWDFYPAYVPPRWSRLAAWRERIVVRLSDGVISVSRPLAALRQDQGARRTAVIPNGVDFPCFVEACHARLPHPPTLLYSGSVDLRWGIDLAIRALPLLRERLPDIRLVIVGAGPAEADLRDLAAACGVAGAVQWMGSVSYDALPALMAGADLGVATSRADAFRQYASPLKLIEYMAAGLPVLCSGGGEAEQIITESGAGVNIPFAPEAFAEAARTLLTDSTAFGQIQQAGLEYARARDWAALGGQMAQIIAGWRGS